MTDPISYTYNNINTWFSYINNPTAIIIISVVIFIILLFTARILY